MDHIENTLTASVKALREVIAPAVDPTDPQAHDQLKLVVDALEFIRVRIDLLPVRGRLELDHHLALGREIVGALRSSASISARAAVDRAVSAAAITAADTHASPADIRSATATLKAAISQLPHDDVAEREQIDQLILDATRRWAVVDRSWYLPLGFDPDPTGVPAVENVLDIRPVTTEREAYR